MVEVDELSANSIDLNLNDKSHLKKKKLKRKGDKHGDMKKSHTTKGRFGARKVSVES